MKSSSSVIGTLRGGVLSLVGVYFSLGARKNATERDIKPFVIARKSFLFDCTPKGADSLGVYFSLILTAQLHGLDPIAYYTDILTRIANPSFLPEHFDALLPWNWAKP